MSEGGLTILGALDRMGNIGKLLTISRTAPYAATTIELPNAAYALHAATRKLPNGYLVTGSQYTVEVMDPATGTAVGSYLHDYHIYTFDTYLADGSFIMGGDRQYTADTQSLRKFSQADCSLLWSRSPAGVVYKVQIYQADGSIYVAASGGLWKYSQSGALQWSKNLGYAKGSTTIITTHFYCWVDQSDGSVVAVGNLSDNDTNMVKYAANGDLLWAVGVGDPVFSSLGAVIINPADQSIIVGAGGIASTSNHGLRKYSKDGTLLAPSAFFSVRAGGGSVPQWQIDPVDGDKFWAFNNHILSTASTVAVCFSMSTLSRAWSAPLERYDASFFDGNNLVIGRDVASHRVSDVGLATIDSGYTRTASLNNIYRVKNLAAAHDRKAFYTTQNFNDFSLGRVLAKYNRELTLLWAVPIPGEPVSIAVHPTKGYIAVAHNEANSIGITVFDSDGAFRCNVDYSASGLDCAFSAYTDRLYFTFDTGYRHVFWVDAEFLGTFTAFTDYFTAAGNTAPVRIKCNPKTHEIITMDRNKYIARYNEANVHQNTVILTHTWTTAKHWIDTVHNQILVFGGGGRVSARDSVLGQVWDQTYTTGNTIESVAMLADGNYLLACSRSPVYDPNIAVLLKVDYATGEVISEDSLNTKASLGSVLFLPDITLDPPFNLNAQDIQGNSALATWDWE